MFKIFVGFEQKGTFWTFAEAVAAFMEKIREHLKEKGQGQISLKWLAFTNYIEHDVFVPEQKKDVKCALYFSDARDIAHRLGIMKEGKVVKNPPVVAAILIDLIFLIMHLETLEERVKKFKDLAARFEEKSSKKDSSIVYEVKLIKN